MIGIGVGKGREEVATGMGKREKGWRRLRGGGEGEEGMENAKGMEQIRMGKRKRKEDGKRGRGAGER